MAAHHAEQIFPLLGNWSANCHKDLFRSKILAILVLWLANWLSCQAEFWVN